MTHSSGGYLHLPEGWERVSAGGPGPFVTSEVLRRPDGTLVRWRSRSHRKGRGGGVRAAEGHDRQGVWWRPDRLDWWIGVLFAVGSLCFALASSASQWGSASRPWIGATFFAGSLFFTTAAYLQYSQAANVEHGVGANGSPRARWRVASWEPRRIDWVASAVQLVGTLFFNLSTFTALNHDLSVHQSNVRVWTPDALGSICFLVASELAYAEVCHRWVCFHGRSLSWRIVALNLVGSLAFGAAAIAGYIEPSTGELVSTRLANAGTTLGALCFLVGALLLLPEAGEAEPAPAPAPGPAPGGGGGAPPGAPPPVTVA